MRIKIDHSNQAIFIPANIENVSVITDVFNIRILTSQLTQIGIFPLIHPFIPSTQFNYGIRVSFNKFSYDLLR
ncbi:MAG: hypothetical protein QNK35_00080 [Bacteroides sp.]|nr:hypothetical protein [Bacteroides sp.]